MHIIVDADAFPNPAKEILLRAVDRTGVRLTLVASKAVRVPASDRIECLVVPVGPDHADDRIVEMVRPGDLVVTTDIPLADRVIAGGATALDPRGELYTAANIKDRLALRDLLEGLRDRGEVGGGPPPFNKKNCMAFANALDRLLTAHIKTRPSGDSPIR
jgi:uncharacterized protein YaiI (UPF0178 family)